jgi:hypothetical protein
LCVVYCRDLAEGPYETKHAEADISVVVRIVHTRLGEETGARRMNFDK